MPLVLEYRGLFYRTTKADCYAHKKYHPAIQNVRCPSGIEPEFGSFPIICCLPKNPRELGKVSGETAENWRRHSFGGPVSGSSSIYFNYSATVSLHFQVPTW